MTPRSLALFTAAFLALLIALCGCTSVPSGSTPTATAERTVHPATADASGVATWSVTATPRPTESIAEQLASVRSENAIWREACRMFRNIHETEYVHPPYTVDDAAGIYRFDCLGFVDHVLMNVTPVSYKKIGGGTNPSIESYAGYFKTLSATNQDSFGWRKVARSIELRPGDVCLWLKPTTLDTGHMWIVAGQPKINPERSDEVLVRIFDSSNAHADDSRTGSAFPTGLGSGILGMMVDPAGDPIGLYWEGGVSTAAGEKDTTIVCGRLNG